MKKIVPILLLSGAAFAASPAFCAPKSTAPSGDKFYRFTDENGKVTIDGRVPVELMDMGYEVVDQMGRVLRVVPPALTDAEKAEAKEKNRKAKEAEEKRLRDLDLLRHYSKVEDLEGTRDRVLKEIMFSIKIAKGNLLAQQEQMQQQQRLAADYERQGKEPPAKVQERISQLAEAITSSEHDIQKREQEYEDTHEEYNVDIARLKVLLSRDY